MTQVHEFRNNVICLENSKHHEDNNSYPFVVMGYCKCDCKFQGCDSCQVQGHSNESVDLRFIDRFYFDLRRLLHFLFRLNQVKESKYKDPNQVYKVPVETYFFNHFIMTTLFDLSYDNLVEDDEIDNNSTENVKAMKACDEKE